MARTDLTTDRSLDGTRTYEARPRGPDGPAPPRHERFEIGAKLGEGGMGVVYRARDTRDGRDVALKLMKGALTGASRGRFEREFRSLSALHHPHCLGVYDYGELGGSPFFTMELFLGRPITSLTGRPLPEVLDALLQLTHALDYVHGHGIVHRDVKPSNVLVRPAARADGSSYFETRLMDFGLAKYYGVQSSLSAEAGFVGTVSYCAPEQINLDELDHRADLYCLGLLSYELLAGRYPFPEARLAGVRALIQAHLNDKPRPLAEVRPEVPAAVADVVMKCLRKQPRRRPDSAAVLRAAIAAYLGVDERGLASGESLVQGRPRLSVTGFVCRAKEQAALADAVLACLRPGGRDAAPALAVVSGEPGIGKSSMIQEAERVARGHGCQVYEGRCFDGNASPFQPFVEILRQVIAEVRLQERREADGPVDVDATGTHVAAPPARTLARLSAVVADYRGEVLRVAPELRKYLPGEAYRQVDFGREADHVYRALAAFFLEIATVQPVCLSFEDLQWADQSSLDLLRHLTAALAEARRSAAAGGGEFPRLVVLASARTGYAALDAFTAVLRDRRQLLDVRLAPLDQAETRELIALRLNCGADDLSDDLVSRIHAACGGNPFFVAETVRDWYEKDAITRTEHGWVLAPGAADSSDLPETVRDVMRLRLQGLPPAAQQVVNASAVIGAVIDLDLLREVLPDLGESDVLDALDLLLPRRVFRETGNPGQVEFVHDLLRELTYADLSAARRESLHRRVGERLETRRAAGRVVAPALLAEHFRNAHDRARAYAYTVEAAGADMDAYAFNNAVARWREARALLPDDAPAAGRCRLAKALGDAHCSLGQFGEAIAAYRDALGHAEAAPDRAAVEHGIGEVYHRSGAYDDAVRHFDASLREVGMPRRLSVPGRLLGIAAASARFHGRPAWLRPPFGGPARERRVELGVANYFRLCQIHSQRQLLDYVHCSYSLAALAKSSRAPEARAVGYAKIGINCGVFSLVPLGWHYQRLAEQATGPGATPYARALVRCHAGYLHYFAGRLDAAEADLRASVDLLDRVGDWLGSFCHHFLQHIHAARGDVAQELTEADTEIALSRARGDAESLAWGLYGKGKGLARAGRLAEAAGLVAEAMDSMTRRQSSVLSMAHAIHGFVLLQGSDYAGARAALERSRALIYQSRFFVEFVGPTFPMLVESLLGPHWAEPVGGPTRAVARRARREARFARLVAWRYPNYRPHALRVSGRAAAALGKTERAARYFERSIAAAERMGARYDLARAWLDAARVLPERADEYRRQARQLLDALGAVVPAAEAV